MISSSIEGDRLMVDLKYRLAKKLDEEALELPPIHTAASLPLHTY